MANKPFITNDPTSDIEKAAETVPWIVNNHDPSYVPGYSEQVQANEIGAADDLEFRNRHTAIKGSPKAHFYKVIGREPKPLPILLKWLRVAGPGGGTSYNADVEVMNHEAVGWRPITLDELKRHGWDKPPAGRVMPDGTIRRLDTQLYAIDGDRGRALERRERAEALAPDEPKSEFGRDTSVPLNVTDNERDVLELTTVEKE